jgi:hypothetical protein
MTPIKLSRWLGACALGSLLVLGCRHSRKCDVVCCDCYQCCEHVQPVPADPPKKKVVDTLPAFDKEQVVIKRDERPNVTYRVVAPGMSQGSGDIVGTEEMTASDADKVGVRPGHTPGALWVPVSHQAPPAMTATEKKAEPAEASENPSVPKMAVPEKPEGEATPSGQTVPELPQ